MFLPIVLVIGVMTRIFRFFEDGNIIGGIAIFSSSFMLVVSCGALLVLSTVICIVRFYKNMYSSEGYLTFTLPVTNSQHIFVKLVAAMACQAVCLLTVIAAVMIAISGELLVDVFNLMFAWIDEFFVIYGTGNAIGFMLEYSILLILAVVFNMLLYYACITVGQTAKKNRILTAVGAYFVYYVATQIIATVFAIVFMVLGMSGALNAILAWASDHMTAVIHVLFSLTALVYAAMTVAAYFITHRIMSRKLNLE